MTRSEAGQLVVVVALTVALWAFAGERLLQHPVVWDASTCGRLLAAGASLVGLVAILARRRR